MTQLLWIELCLKLAAGLGLMCAPRILVRILGLPSADERFWPRVLGAMLLGLAAASGIENHFPGKGLGFAGSIAINLAIAAMLAALLVLDKAGRTRRGRMVLWLAAILLCILSFVEIAFAFPALR